MAGAAETSASFGDNDSHESNPTEQFATTKCTTPVVFLEISQYRIIIIFIIIIILAVRIEKGGLFETAANMGHATGTASVQESRSTILSHLYAPVVYRPLYMDLFQSR